MVMMMMIWSCSCNCALIRDAIDHQLGITSSSIYVFLPLEFLSQQWRWRFNFLKWVAGFRQPGKDEEDGSADSRLRPPKPHLFFFFLINSLFSIYFFLFLFLYSIILQHFTNISQKLNHKYHLPQSFEMEFC